MWIPRHGILQSGRNQLLLDLYPNAAAAYSLRKLRSGYTGAAIRVRRSSDNTEQDIGFDNNGNLNISALTSFVGSNNGTIAIWYDQGINGINVSQTIDASKPTIVNSGSVNYTNGKPTVVFDGVNDFLVKSVFAGLTQPDTYILVGKKNSSTTSRGDYLSIRETAANAALALYSKDNSSITTFSGVELTGTATVTNFFLSTSIFNTTSSLLYINGNQIASGNVGTRNAAERITIGAVYDGVSSYIFYLNGNISEIIIYGSSQLSNRTGIEANINSYYTIY